jgi:hypothetical protein
MEIQCTDAAVLDFKYIRRTSYSRSFFVFLDLVLILVCESHYRFHVPSLQNWSQLFSDSIVQYCFSFLTLPLTMGFLRRKLRERFEEKKPRGLTADIRMISGCEDAQTSADVSNVSSL